MYKFTGMVILFILENGTVFLKVTFCREDLACRDFARILLKTQTKTFYFAPQIIALKIVSLQLNSTGHLELKAHGCT